MADFQNLCPGCMRPLPVGTTVCPHCSRNVDEAQTAPLLPKRFVLGGKYIIGLKTDIGSDCVTYAGFDTKRQLPVFICEFLPENLIIRNEGESELRIRVGYEEMYASCLQSFVELWKTLMSLNKTPALPFVREILSANSTAYAVFEYYDSITLAEYFNGAEKKLSWNRALTVFRPVLFALKALNSRGVIHGFVSTSTIRVCADGKLCLSDFSIPQAKSDVIELRSLPAVGFSPLELSDRRLKPGSYTDVYSFMAVLYTALTGFTVQSAADRAVNDMMVIPRECAAQLPEGAIEIVLGALQVYPENRIRSVDALYSLLYPGNDPLSISSQSAEGTGEAAVKEEPSKKEEKEQLEEESGAAMALKIILTAVIVFSMVFLTAYSTVLYKYFQIPFLDSALSSVSFLPMNSGTRPAPKPTTEPESTTQREIKPKKVKVADFTQLTYNDIVNNETFKKNFNLIFEFETSAEVEKDSIISQSIEAGESVDPGTTITIVVSKGKPYVVLKDVLGMDYNDAYRVLTQDGFEVQKKIRKNDGTKTPNQVYLMSLVAGLEFEKGTVITLTVWGDTQSD